MPWMPVHNCKKPVLVCRVLCSITTWSMYCWCYACFSNLHVLFYLVSPSLLVVIFFIAQCNPIICMMIKEDNKVSVFCILYSVKNCLTFSINRKQVAVAFPGSPGIATRLRCKQKWMDSVDLHGAAIDYLGVHLTNNQENVSQVRPASFAIHSAILICSFRSIIARKRDWHDPDDTVMTVENEIHANPSWYIQQLLNSKIAAEEYMSCA